MAAQNLTLDLWTFDVGAGLKAATVAECAEEVSRRVEESWASGADLVLFPEFAWMSLEPLLEDVDHGQPTALHAVAHCFWEEIFPALRLKLARPGKAVVLGTAPFVDKETGRLFNRAPILADGRVLHQDKLHLTPWEKDFTPGESLMIWQFGGLRVAVIVCLDIEIPELAARLRGREIDLILCPSATETVLGVERVDRCASARAVELGCYVGVAHLVGQTRSALIDHNVGRLALYRPSQAAFRKEERCTEGPVLAEGFERLRVTLSAESLRKMRRLVVETNPSLLGRESAGFVERSIPISYDTESS